MHKKIILYFWILIAVGIVIAIIAIPAQNIGIDDINGNFVDQNIISAASPGIGIGKFIWTRLISAFLPLILLFLCCVISNFTALIVFPFMVVQGYWLVMTIWWVICEYGLGAIVLLMFYILLLAIVAAILVACVIWLMKLTAGVRRFGFRCGFNWKEVLLGITIIACTEIILALVEYLVYWVFLARIIY